MLSPQEVKSYTRRSHLAGELSARIFLRWSEAWREALASVLGALSFFWRPAMSSTIAAEHARRSQDYAAAPVFGNPDAAKARELFIIAAGQSDQVDRCRPIFDVVGQRTFVVGSDPAGANLVKLAGNARPQPPWRCSARALSQ
jgi:NAD binding domain of 6-phosphogluconate dehydrogenase